MLSCEAEEKITETSPMEKIITHIHENFTRTITVNELAKLAHSSKTVAEIAEEVGYDSVTAFIKIFKRKTNYAPSVYRKMQTSH